MHYHDRLDRLLYSTKCHLEHTPMHEEEPIYGATCLAHILEELDELVEHMTKHRAGLSYLAPHHITAAEMVSLDKLFDVLIHELDEVHQELRHPDAANVAKAKTILDDARKDVHRAFHDILDEAKKHLSTEHFDMFKLK